MALTVWDPFTQLARLDRQFDGIIRRTWSDPRPGNRDRDAGYIPAADLRTEGEDVVISLELPGVDVDNDVDIEVTRGRLSISGHREHRQDSKGENGRVLISEHRYGAFRREFALPESVDTDRVEAGYEHGVLRVRVPGVNRPSAESRKVEIRQADSPKAVEGTTPEGAATADATLA